MKWTVENSQRNTEKCSNQKALKNGMYSYPSTSFLFLFSFVYITCQRFFIFFLTIYFFLLFIQSFSSLISFVYIIFSKILHIFPHDIFSLIHTIFSICKSVHAKTSSQKPHRPLHKTDTHKLHYPVFSLIAIGITHSPLNKILQNEPQKAHMYTDTYSTCYH